MKCMTNAASVLAMLLATMAGAHADETGEYNTPPADTGYWSALTPKQKMIATNAGVIGFIAGWGAVNWDYGNNRWTTASEGWFDRETDEGGADKAGHLYTGYTLGRSLTGLFRHYGYDHENAAWVGAASSLAAMTFMEFGDGYSPYGFSGEDQAMNLAGAGAAWLLAANPMLDRKLALRGEYEVDLDHTGDVLTDYERWRYYLVLKLDGFEHMPAPLRWLELHAGYFARGYADADPDNNERSSFVGVGVNLGKLAAAHGWRRTGVLLNYFQLPNTAARTDNTRR